MRGTYITQERHGGRREGVCAYASSDTQSPRPCNVFFLFFLQDQSRRAEATSAKEVRIRRLDSGVGEDGSGARCLCITRGLICCA